MALLISEDNEVKSSLEIVFLKNELQEKESISWVPYKLILLSAKKSLTFETESSNKGAGDYVLSLKPVNEIDNLISGIQSFLGNENKEMFSFEGLEPSFELIFERSHKGYAVYFWIDAGNVISDHYTWDGFGLRFFTSEKNIKSFVNELEKCKRELQVE